MCITGPGAACGGSVAATHINDGARTADNVNFLRHRISAPDRHASVAQGIEQRPSNPPVGGSIPSWGTMEKRPGSRTGALVFSPMPCHLQSSKGRISSDK
jgi:hypothetical protein